MRTKTELKWGNLKIRMPRLIVDGVLWLLLNSTHNSTATYYTYIIVAVTSVDRMTSLSLPCINPHKVCDPWSARRQTYGCHPGFKTSPFNCTAWWQRQVCMSRLPRAVPDSAVSKTWNLRLHVSSPTCSSHTTNAHSIYVNVIIRQCGRKIGLTGAIFRLSCEMDWFITWSLGVWRHLRSGNPRTVDRNLWKMLQIALDV